jgi:hypothetical protein
MPCRSLPIEQAQGPVPGLGPGAGRATASPAPPAAAVQSHVRGQGIVFADMRLCSDCQMPPLRNSKHSQRGGPCAYSGQLLAVKRLNSLVRAAWQRCGVG